MRPSHRGPRMGCGQGSLTPTPTPPTVGGQHPAPHRRGRVSGLLQKTLPVNWTHKYPLFLGQCGKNRPGTRRERTSDTLLCPDQEAGHPPMHKCFHLQYWKVGNTLSVSQGGSGSFPNPAEVPNSRKLSLSVFHVPRPEVLVSFLYSVFFFLIF